ncbi:MAG: DUF4184 family protein [Chitinophagaceae bacterium]|nr:MAG: DUF4184 family protein [Chitinophagaceae bacterium]
MPFTISHPAIVLPLQLAPRYFSLTGLVIGSMAPDFEYFLRMVPKAVYGHTVSGIFYFDLPLAFLLAFVFHNVVRKSLIDNLPAFFKSRFIQFRNFNWNNSLKSNWPVIIISLVIGCASHLFWDSFTHASGFFVNEFPALLSKVNVAGRHLPYYNILQHTSSLIGGLVILYTISKMPSVEILKLKIWKYWAIVFSVIVLTIALRMIAGLEYNHYGELFVSSISGLLLGLIVASSVGSNVKSATQQ